MKLTYRIDQSIQLKEYLASIQISGKFLAALKTKGDLLVNGVHQNVLYELQPNDILEVVFPYETRGEQMDPIEMDLDIVYEDEYLLIVNKPAGIPCIPDHRYDQTLANGIIAYFDRIGISSTAHFINRLDKETSGLLIVGKYRFIHHLLSNGHIDRRYKAIVDGIIEEDQIIHKKIGREGLSVKRCISDQGKDAITKVTVLQHFDHQTLIECQLFTGRTHQIRVHLSSIGHPLSGDSLYGSEGSTYYLHSYSIAFEHPITHEQIYITKGRDYQ